MKQQIISEMCTGCNKVVDFNLDGIEISKGFCKSYEDPWRWHEKGNCPLRNPGDLYNRLTGSIDFFWMRLVDHKITRGKQTAGRTKGERCKTSPIDGYMAKKSRSYKHPNYRAWCEKMRKRTKGM